MTETMVLELLSDTPLSGKEIALYCRVCEVHHINIHQLHYLFHQQMGQAVLRLQLDSSDIRELPSTLQVFRPITLPIGFTAHP